MRCRPLWLAAVVGGCSFSGPDPATVDGPGNSSVDAGPIDGPMNDAPLPPPDAAVCAGGCDDADPCTVDACTASATCEHIVMELPADCGTGTVFSCAGEATCYAQCSTTTPWVTAEISCQAWGGFLATVLTDAESTCLGAAIPPGGRRWIGYYQPPVSSEPDGGWLWISGDAAAPDPNWSPAQPNNASDTDPLGQDCVFVQAPTGMWNDDECAAFDQGFVCER